MQVMFITSCRCYRYNLKHNFINNFFINITNLVGNRLTFWEIQKLISSFLTKIFYCFVLMNILIRFFVRPFYTSTLFNHRSVLIPFVHLSARLSVLPDMNRTYNLIVYRWFVYIV